MSQDQENTLGRDVQQWTTGVLPGGWQVERNVEESVFTEAEAPSRGRKPLPQAGSQGARGNEIIHQMRR